MTTGASNDMRQATSLARSMVTQWGMSEELGPRTYGTHEDMIFLGREIHENRDYSEKIAEKIDKEIDRLIDDGLKTAHELLKKHTEAVDRIVAKLLKDETIERDAFNETVGVIKGAGKAA
jgi:cell division protease FtsH